MPLTPELTRLLNHVHLADADATLCDAAERLDTLTDAQLALICGTEPGPCVCGLESLSYSSELRQRISDEIDDLELALPYGKGLLRYERKSLDRARQEAVGEIGLILGEVPCERKSRERCSSR